MSLRKFQLLCALVLASGQAAACYTVYDSAGRVVYHEATPPVDMSMALHEALAQRFAPGAKMVFNQQEKCRQLSLSQIAGPLQQPASLLTDRETAQNVQHTPLAGGVVLVAPADAALIKRTSFTVLQRQ